MATKGTMGVFNSKDSLRVPSFRIPEEAAVTGTESAFPDSSQLNRACVCEEAN